MAQQRKGIEQKRKELKEKMRSNSHRHGREDVDMQNYVTSLNAEPGVGVLTDTSKKMKVALYDLNDVEDLDGIHDEIMQEQLGPSGDIDSPPHDDDDGSLGPSWLSRGPVYLGDDQFVDEDL